MTDPIKSDLSNAEQAAKAAFLAKVNQEKSWLAENKEWLIACLSCLISGFILGHLV